MELTIEKSTGLANLIEAIKLPLHLIDVEYAKEVVKAMYKQASFEDSTAVLNRRYYSNKSNLLRKQAAMIDHLIDFVELGKECDKLKNTIAATDDAYTNIEKLFI